MNRCLVFAILGIALTGCNTGVTPLPIVVGHVSDNTRPDKAGEQAELGIRLALAELSKDDALAEALGGRKILVHHTDTRGELDAFESQAVRLVAVNRCITLFGGLSAKEVAKLDHAQTPLLTFYGGPVVGASNQVFYLGMAPSRQGEVLAKIIPDHAKTDRVAILLDERRADLATLAEIFQKTLAIARKHAEAKPTNVVIQRFGKDVKWAEIVETMQSQKPQVVLFAGGVQDFNGWHKVFRGGRIIDPPTVLYAGDDGDQRLFDLDHDPKTSVLFATAFHADPANPKIAAFLKAYQDAFQTDADVHAALAYDGFRLFVEALKKAQPQPTLERLREEIQKTKDFEGLTGPLSVNAERLVDRPLSVVHWQNGKLTAVKTFPVVTVSK